MTTTQQYQTITTNRSAATPVLPAFATAWDNYIRDELAARESGMWL